MKQKGSITVFLSLVLVLLSSFIFTSLEAARIVGSRFYLSMLTSLSGESFLASYYYPLFEEYGLLGVEAGYESAYLSEQQMEQELGENIAYGAEEMQGGMLQIEQTSVQLNDYQTLLSENCSGFLEQVKKQSLYEGTELALEQLLSQGNQKDTVSSGKLFQAQEELQEKAANTAVELLRLMTLIDGIATGQQGLSTDQDGRLKAQTPFVKQLTSLSPKELSDAFETEEIFQTVKSFFLYPKAKAASLQDLLGTALELEGEIEQLNCKISEYHNRIEAIPSEIKLLKQQKKEWEELLAELDSEEEKAVIKERITECESQMTELLEEEAYCKEQRTISQKEKKTKETKLSAVIKEVKPSYTALQTEMQEGQKIIAEALTVVDALEEKQRLAWAAALTYEGVLKGEEAELSSELYQVFSEELNQLKMYLGMEEQGYSTTVMRKTLLADEQLLQELALPTFHAKQILEMYLGISQVMHRIEEYSLEGLWFDYGEIKAGAQTGESITETMEKLLATGILGLVGISEDELSKAELSGEELPSNSRKTTTVETELTKQIADMQEQLSSDSMFVLLQSGIEGISEEVLLELYLSGYFSNFLSEKGKTRLCYEREYIMFGQETDVKNLCAMILSLTAFRFAFTMTSLLFDSARRESAGALAAALVGFSGLPILIYAVKYAILFLWAVEEALVETAAIVQGKKIALFSKTGMISLHEIFTMNKEQIQAKARAVPTGSMGAGYTEYLLLLSLFEGTEKKCYRAMDLIQENLRLRFRDSFRIRNVVIRIDFSSKAQLRRKFDTGFFSELQYELQTEYRAAYE